MADHLAENVPDAGPVGVGGGTYGPFVAHIHGRCLREKLIKIGAKIVSYVSFPIAQVAVSGQMFQDFLSLIARLRAPLTPA